MILTVCTGNICRSPTAQSALQRGLIGVPVQSAGIHAVVGADVDHETREAAKILGLEMPGHEAKQLCDDLVINAKAIIVMEDHHIAQLSQRWPFARGKTFLMGHFEMSKQISDPYMKGSAAHIHSVAEIIKSADFWLPKLREFL